MLFYWPIWLENQTLVADQLDGEHDPVVVAITEPVPARIPPFEAIVIDLADVLGD